jgi:hypothetical protein
MAAKPFIAARISEDLNLKLDDYLKITGESRTQAILNALSAYIGYSPNKEVGDSASDRLTLLEKKVAELESILKEPKQISLLQDSSSKAPKNLQLTTDNIFDNVEQNEFSKDNQGVINLDNNADNDSDNTDNTDNSEASTTEAGLKHPSSQYGDYLGQMRTQDVPSLPGLELQDVKKIKSKLNNTSQLKGVKVARINPYILFLTILDKGEGKKKELLWDVYKTENIPITADNN